MAEQSTGGSRAARHVWLVNHYAAAPDEAAGTRHFELGRQLVARGHRVTIFAASFGHYSSRERRLRGRALAHREWRDGVLFVWLRTVPYRGNTWRRQVNMLSFLVVFLVAQLLEARPDYVIGSTVHPFAAFGGWLAARLRRATFAFEIRDLWPQTLIDLGALRRGSPGELVLRTIEAFLVRRASAVITLLPGIRDYLATQGLPTDHVVYIPNGADLAMYGGSADAGMSVDEARGGAPDAVRHALGEISRLRSDGRFVVGYLGAFGRVNRADLIAQAAVEADSGSSARIGAVLIGQGPESAAVEERAGGQAAVSVCRPIPKQYVPQVLGTLDAAVVHTTYTPVYRYGISFNKLFEYMAAGLPVVFACDTAYDPVAGTGCGITVRPDDAEALAEAFLDLAALPEDQRRSMGAAGRAYVEAEHSFDRLGATLAALVEAPSPRGR